MNHLFLLSTHKQNSVCLNEQTKTLKLSTLNTSMEKQITKDGKQSEVEKIIFICGECKKDITVSDPDLINAFQNCLGISCKDHEVDFK